ncbi:HEAT repeat domain-containing protein [Paenibacillus sp. LHD-117]|uniref:HEAT repeat domain-containing protein n=1 Tax=Paenibacillus sp. LHD-117 TaxID=3071412 RepID=UPI0027E0D457|nr:HEAT repeat domain-containing protein [Paenibacillus sp. LHD-117]MDQ6419745.1 HEAT repeat domain-containing protein [Paenibacillus sp. LHD-117]
MIDSNYLLTDEQMVQFITKGYLVLHNELPGQLHQGIMNQIHHVMHNEGNPGNNILPRVPDIQQVFDTPVVKGALSSVLGPDYYMHPHRHCHYNQPGNGSPGGGQWHKDGYWSSMRSHRPWWVMLFYYTHDITEELGPTAIMPGTQYYEKFIGKRGETLLPTGKAGTMVLVHFDLWHKASLNVSQLDRYMLKFQFVRLSAPEFPSWNHQNKEMIVPDGTPALHLNLWQDVWNWLRGERSSNQDHDTAAMDERISASALGDQLNDPVETTALNAAYALGQLGDEGIAILIKHIKGGSNQTAERAAYGLQSAGIEAIPELLHCLTHIDERRRALAIFVLGMIGSPEGGVMSALISSLNDESEWVCRNAIEALGQLRNPDRQAVSALAKCLKESVLSESGDASELSAPNESNKTFANHQPYIMNKIGYTAALSLLRIGKAGDMLEVVNSLETALFNSKDRYVRAYAAEALTHLRSKEAVDLLIRYYRSSRWCPDTSKASTF